MSNMFLKIIHNLWPMLFIFTIIIISIRITYLICNKQKFVLHKEIKMLFFLFYILLLYYVVTFQDNNYGTNNFILFKEIFRYNITSKLFLRNVLGNIILFIPLGIFSTDIIKNKTFIPIFFISLVVSCSIEFAQSMIDRTADIDDVILNVLGGIIGYVLYKYANKIFHKFPKIIKNKLFLDVLSLFLIFIIIYLAFKFNFWRFIA